MIRDTPPSELYVDDAVCLKRLRVENAALIFNAINNDREHLLPWLPFVVYTKKPEDTEIFIKSVLHSHCPKKDLIYEIWHEDHFAGLIALKEIDGWNKKTELGYWILSSFENLGLVTKSCATLIDLAFHEMGLNRMQLKAAVGNAKSCMVAERLNFKMEGIERSGELHHQKYFNLVVYSLLKNEWQRT